jgi:hypothetical protein
MTTPSAMPDPFEELLGRELGPASAETPPSALREAILSKVALLPDPALLRRRNRLRIANGVALLFLALALAWAARGADSALAGWLGNWSRDSIQLGAPDWRQGLELLLGSDWWEAARSPLALAVVSLLLFPLFYFLLEER